MKAVAHEGGSGKQGRVGARGGGKGSATEEAEEEEEEDEEEQVSEDGRLSSKLICGF